MENGGATRPTVTVVPDAAGTHSLTGLPGKLLAMARRGRPVIPRNIVQTFGGADTEDGKTRGGAGRLTTAAPVVGAQRAGASPVRKTPAIHSAKSMSSLGDQLNAELAAEAKELAALCGANPSKGILDPTDATAVTLHECYLTAARIATVRSDTASRIRATEEVAGILRREVDAIEELAVMIDVNLLIDPPASAQVQRKQQQARDHKHAEAPDVPVGAQGAKFRHPPLQMNNNPADEITPAQRLPPLKDARPPAVQEPESPIESTSDGSHQEPPRRPLDAFFKLFGPNERQPVKGKTNPPSRFQQQQQQQQQMHVSRTAAPRFRNPEPRAVEPSDVQHRSGIRHRDPNMRADYDAPRPGARGRSPHKELPFSRQPVDMLTHATAEMKRSATTLANEQLGKQSHIAAWAAEQQQLAVVRVRQQQQQHQQHTQERPVPDSWFDTNALTNDEPLDLSGFDRHASSGMASKRRLPKSSRRFENNAANTSFELFSDDAGESRNFIVDPPTHRRPQQQQQQQQQQRRLMAPPPNPRPSWVDLLP